MAVNFPDSPTNGDTKVVNGATYTWDGVKWDTTSIADNILATYNSPSELPTTGLTNGDVAWVAGTTNGLYISNGTGWLSVALTNQPLTITQGGAGSYILAIDGTPTVITLTATDPEGLPITWSYTVSSGSLTNGGGTTATITQADNVFTITPTTTEAYAGTFGLTFTANDGVNTATDVNTFTLEFITIVQDSKYTSALFTTRSGAVDNDINGPNVTDQTGTRTFAGAPSAWSTWTPFKSGGYSVYLDGTNDNLSISSTTDFGFGTGDFTVECWAYYDGTDATNDYIFDFRVNGGSSELRGALYPTAENGNWEYWVNGVAQISNGTFNGNRWYHIALVRASSLTTLYINGTSIGNFSDVLSYADAPLLIGQRQGFTAQTWKGYISDFRVVKGTAVYTANFTPPTERLTAITNTVLLTCAANTFKDDSASAHTITTNENPRITGFIPYDYIGYDKDENTGSYYQNGAGGYFTSTALIPTANYTIEAWVYVTGYNANSTLAAVHALSGGRSWLMAATDSLISMSENGGGAGISVNGNYLHRWTHIAWTWDGTTQKLYINGVMSASGALSSLNSSTSQLVFGFNLDNAPTSWYYNGYVTNVRFSDTVRYTTDFDPLSGTNKFTVDANTDLLIDASEDQAIINKSQQYDYISLIGNTKASATQTKNATTSMYFDGNGDYIFVSNPTPSPSKNNYVFSDLDFTVEAWIYPTTSGTIRGIINNWSSGGAFILALNASDQISFKYTNAASGTSTIEKLSTDTITSNQWTHIAVVRNGNSVSFYINGQLDSSGAQTMTDTIYYYNGAVKNTYIGHAGDSLNFFTGYMEDIRVTKGVARYTANFTPPTQSLEA